MSFSDFDSAWRADAPSAGKQQLLRGGLSHERVHAPARIRHSRRPASAGSRSLRSSSSSLISRELRSTIHSHDGQRFLPSSNVAYYSDETNPQLYASAWDRNMHEHHQVPTAALRCWTPNSFERHNKLRFMALNWHQPPAGRSTWALDNPAAARCLEAIAYDNRRACNVGVTIDGFGRNSQFTRPFTSSPSWVRTRGGSWGW
eukprot:TRINITY_DN110604_c0_g1_i1.p1 TRINITY_DN110604_c0_g1~~TRINITY_DN110604_c0_g1_i1.p1  ORF type:complete len:202 (+),score=10.57 TRINITY_DN110604_c0_g1_i1:137-742(+)